MRALIILLLLWFSPAVLSNPFARLTLEQPDAQVAAGYAYQDLCWTTETPEKECFTQGHQVSLLVPREYYYFHFHLLQLETESTLEHDAASLGADIVRTGVGTGFRLSDHWLSRIEVSYIIETDDEYFFGDQNFNAGYGVGAQLLWDIRPNLRIGYSVEYQRYQNCSHPDCHGLKGAKPQMDNIEGSVSVDYRLSNKGLVLHYSVYRNIHEPVDSRSVGRSSRSSHLVSLVHEFK